MHFAVESAVIFLSIVYAAVSFSATVNGTLGVKAINWWDALTHRENY